MQFITILPLATTNTIRHRLLMGKLVITMTPSVQLARVISKMQTMELFMDMQQ